MKQIAALLFAFTAMMICTGTTGSGPSATVSEVEPGQLEHVFRCEADTLDGGGFRFRLVVLATHPGLQQEHRVRLRVGQYPGRWIRSEIAGEPDSDGSAYSIIGSREMVSDALLEFSHNSAGINNYRVYEFRVGKWFERSR